MGAEWPAGAALAMETWPARSRGFMSGILQGSWGLASCCPAPPTGCCTTASVGAACCGSASCRRLPCVYVRYFVKEPEVWVENRRQQREQDKRCTRRCSASSARRAGQHHDRVLVDGERLHCLLFDIRRCSRRICRRTCISTPAMVATADCARQCRGFRCAVASGAGSRTVLGRRWSMIIPAVIGVFVTPLYLLTTDATR